MYPNCFFISILYRFHFLCVVFPLLAFLKQQGVGVKGTNKSAPVNEDVPPLLEANGKIEVNEMCSFYFYFPFNWNNRLSLLFMDNVANSFENILIMVAFKVWRINGSAKTPVPKEDIGKFYSGDCYIILYTYHSGEKKEDYYMCWWIGKDSIEVSCICVIWIFSPFFLSIFIMLCPTLLVAIP